MIKKKKINIYLLNDLANKLSINLYIIIIYYIKNPKY